MPGNYGSAPFAGGIQSAPAGSPSPPFALNSAYNGLSVDTGTGQIVLGQDVGDISNPAILISNREIPLDVFDLIANDANGHPMLSLSPSNALAQLAAYDNAANGFIWTADGNAGELAGKVNNGRLLSLDWINELYQLGDIDNFFGNALRLSIDQINGVSQIVNNSFAPLFLDTPNGSTILGANQVSGQLLHMDDGSSVTTLGNLATGDIGLEIDYINQFYKLGSSPVMGKKGTQLLVDEMIQRVSIRQSAGNELLQADFVNDLLYLGDPNNVKSNIRIIGASNIDLRTASTVSITGIGGPGTGDLDLQGGTFLLLTNTALTNNAAAALGTLTNAPAAGNPTKWIRILDGGTPRFIPAW